MYLTSIKRHSSFISFSLIIAEQQPYKLQSDCDHPVIAISQKHIDETTHVPTQKSALLVKPQTHWFWCETAVCYRQGT